MIASAETDNEVAERRQHEIASVARELAGYGFYVMDALLPDDIRAKSVPSRTQTPPADKTVLKGRLVAESAGRPGRTRQTGPDEP